jgi:hypothetical protein
MRKRANPMVGSRIGDHTTTLRLENVGAFRAVFLALEDKDAVALCERLMREDMAALLSPEVYRPWHNHGVMADTAILEALETLGAMGSDDANLREFVVRRGMASQAALYDEAGTTREHSVSYQEHNYPVVMRFLRAAAGETSSHQRVKQDFRQDFLAQASREMFSHFTRSNGQFFPVGDSFRLPNRAILEAHPEIDPALVRTEEAGAGPERVYCKGGFFSYSRDVAAARVHFVATGSWNSGRHKQDDDLSFCLELGGTMIFDDPGYSDSAKPDVAKLLGSADVHSVVTVQGRPFGDRGREPSGSSLREWSCHAGGFELRGSHSRIPGVIVRRCWTLTGNRLTLTDWIKVSDQDEADKVGSAGGMHGFVLAPAVTFAEIDAGILILLKCDGRAVGVLRATDDSGGWSATTIPHVGTDRRQVGRTTRLVYTAPACFGHTFEFTFA